MIKQRQESVELYDKGGRAELANQEREEIAIITRYLPKQMSEDDVKAAISADRGAEGEIRRADGFRQSQWVGEGGADFLTSPRLRGEVEAEAERRLRVRGTLRDCGACGDKPLTRSLRSRPLPVKNGER
jgi:hypothetical protein